MRASFIQDKRAGASEQGKAYMHVHPMPDLIQRGFSDKECGYAAISTGMDGFVIKNHYRRTLCVGNIGARSEYVT